jgi:fatty-acyl-CoA synthase
MALMERSTRFTVASALTTRATSDPGRDFLLSRSGAFTYGEVDSQSDSLAAALAQLGVEAGDRIALVLPACPEFVISLFAASKLGAVIVPLDPRMPPTELQYMLRHSEAVCAVAVEEAHGVEFLQLFEDLLVRLPELQYLVTVGEEDLWYDDRIFQFEDLLSVGAGREYRVPELRPEEDCFAIVYTSGTTGKPKGVRLSHRNLMSVAAGTAEGLGLGMDDRIVGVSALFHVFGLGPGLLSTALSGAALALEDWPDAGRTLDLVALHQGTVLYGVPTHFVAALAEQRRQPRDVSSLRIVMAAGAPVGDELIRHIREELCPLVLVAYSLAETSSTLCMSRPEDPTGKQRFTVGRPLPGTELKIVERDGEELPVESVGEIAVRGPGVMLGYHRQPGETAETFDSQGFLLTGDLGIVDEEGFVHLVGRRKEVIIRAGFNVYPREVETRLEAHPAVREAAVVGVSDPLLGEASCACIVPVEGAIVTNDEILDWCRETLADPKIPDQVRFLDAFPRTGTGKIRRIELSRLVQSGGRSA